MRAGAVVGAALAVLRRQWRRAYLAAAVATLVNTVPDVLRQVLVWHDRSALDALLVDVLGFATGLLAQLWVTGALVDLPGDGRLRLRGALRRGTGLAVAAVRTSLPAVVSGVVVGGGVSALVTLPASVAALGWHRVLGPLAAPGVGAFAVASASDVVASCLTLPFLALVLVLVAGRSDGHGPGVGSKILRPGTGRP